MEESWSRELFVCDQKFTINFLRRPFREGLEVSFECLGVVIRWNERGYGEEIILQRALEQITKSLDEKKALE